MRRARKPRNFLSARDAAIALLSRRDYATAELRERLERRGFDRMAVDSTLAELVEDRALDDARYATNYVSYQAARGQGPLRIAADLQAAGVSGELIDAAVASVADWPQAAREVRLRKFGPQIPSEWAEKARQARFLQYRGFSSDHIRSALGADFDLD